MSLVKDLLLIVFFGLSLAVAACGSSSSDDGDGDGGDFTLTSSADDDGFDPGETIPDRYSCEELGGENRIPKITWSGVPEAAESLALVVIDTTADADETVHALLINLDPATTSLTNSSVVSADQAVVQYLGPCPVGHTETHTYEATIHALNVAEVAVDDPDDTDAVIDDIEAASIGSDSIRGTFTAD